MSMLCAIPVVSAFLNACAAPEPLATGYVEGDYVLIAPVETARIEKLGVARGDHFSAGQPLVELERQDAEIAVAQAKAGLAQAASQLADLKQGKRAEEIAMIEASLNSAKAQSAEAERKLTRAAVELAKLWRTERALRRLEALLLVADREASLIITGNGDVIEPEDSIMAIGSGGSFALSAARALYRNTELDARTIVEQSLKIAGEICVYTNQHHTIEELSLS